MLGGGFLELVFNWLLCQLNPPHAMEPKAMLGSPGPYLCPCGTLLCIIPVRGIFQGWNSSDSILGSRNCWEVFFINVTYNCIFFITEAALNCLHLLPGSTLLHLQLGSPHSTAANLCSFNLYPESRFRLPL